MLDAISASERSSQRRPEPSRCRWPSIVAAAEALAAPRCLQRHHRRALARASSRYDHLPGAVNWPSLNDAERASVGTEYKQVSPFDARKRGAALVARNIAAHIERHVLDKPRDWSPLVYCWRGGQRSGSLGLVLDQIGFRVHRARRRLPGVPPRRRRRARDAAARASRSSSSAAPPARGKSLLLRALADARRAGARPRGARQPPRLGARPRARRDAAVAEGVRHRGLERAAQARPGAAGVRREREREGRRPARAAGADRAHARLAVRLARSGDGCPRRRC